MRHDPPRTANIFLALVALLCLLLIIALAAAWWRSGEQTLVVYTAHDAEFSAAIFEEFTRQSGIVVASVFDTEATKTVGLAERIRAERARPRCDVFWNNELVNTLRLDHEGLFVEYASPAAESYPAQYRSPQATWHGFAARARVLIVHRERVTRDDRPGSILDLADERWRGRCGMAKPLFGTTATHASVLFAHWGGARAKEYFQSLKANDVKIMAGNRHVAQAVAAGELDFGITDTDDAVIQLESGMPIAIIYPDQASGEMGTLFIPNTVAILRGCPHPDAAQRLVDFLLSPRVEELLARGPSAQIPLNPAVEIAPRVETPQTVRAMDVDFQAARAAWDEAAAFLRDEFATAP